MRSASTCFLALKDPEDHAIDVRFVSVKDMPEPAAFTGRAIGSVFFEA